MSDNPLVPTQEIEIGGKTRLMRMDLNAMIDYERVTGKAILRGEIDFDKLSIPDLRALLWACLVQTDESLTEREVGSWLGVASIPMFTSAIITLFVAAMPKADEEAPDPLTVAGEGSTG